MYCLARNSRRSDEATGLSEPFLSLAGRVVADGRSDRRRHHRYPAVLAHSHHYVSLSPRLTWRLQVQPKRQIRLTTMAGANGAYTLWEIHEDPDTDLRLSRTGRDPLELSVGDTVKIGTIVPTAPNVTTARETAGVAEAHDRHGDQPLVAAPHAGKVEPRTGEIAERVHERMRATASQAAAGNSTDLVPTPSTSTMYTPRTSIRRRIQRSVGSQTTGTR